MRCSRRTSGGIGTFLACDSGTLTPSLIEKEIIDVNLLLARLHDRLQATTTVRVGQPPKVLGFALLEEASQLTQPMPKPLGVSTQNPSIVDGQSTGCRRFGIQAHPPVSQRPVWMPIMTQTMNNPSPTLNSRQSRFVTLVASGVPAGRAYEQAGYASKGAAADAAASRLLRNDKVAKVLEDERKRSKSKARWTRCDKLAVLEAIMDKEEAPARERITAIKVHNEMTGDNEPQAITLNTEGHTLASIRKIAEDARIVSPLIAHRLIEQRTPTIPSPRPTHQGSCGPANSA